MFVEQESNWQGDNCKHHYFISIYNQQQIIVSLYNILNTENFNYTLYTGYVSAVKEYCIAVRFGNISIIW